MLFLRLTVHEAAAAETEPLRGRAADPAVFLFFFDVRIVTNLFLSPAYGGH
jgi:hypothetical protein